MASALRKRPDLPTEEEIQLATETSRKLAAIIGHDQAAQLHLHDGDDTFTVPVSAIRLLAEILNQMARGNAVSLVPIGHTLTTQQAADILNVSRPYLVKLLEAGTIPFTKVGRHRRIKYEDLREYMQKVDEEARRAADELTAEAQDLGLGY